jgi:hypothetical protein
VRRRPAAALTTLSLATSVLVLPGSASAQIYTRRNGNGVVEATNVPDAGDFVLTYQGKGTLIHSRGYRRHYNGQFDHHILAASAAHFVSVDLIKAVMAQESEFDALAVSSKGARGLMQLMPATARRFGVTDSFDPRQNIFGGAQYLRFLLDLFNGDVSLALAGYNAGENAVRRYRGIPPYRETRNYVQRIMANLGNGIEQAQGQVRAAAFYTPSRTLGPAPKGPAKPVKLAPARPRVYYRWRDERGVLHVSETAPGEGTAYSMVRALD